MFKHDVNDKRNRIMRSATGVFVQKGFCQATVEEIALAAEVGKGTVYEYFNSKEDLFCSIFQEGHNYFMEVFREKLNEKSSPAEKLKNGVIFWTEFVFAHRELAWLLFSARVNVEPFLIVEEHHQNFIKLLTDFFEQGIVSGDFRPCNAELMAYLFTGYCRAICGYMMSYPEKEIKPLSGDIVHLLLGGVCA